jgi:hypothetical protein
MAGKITMTLANLKADFCHYFVHLRSKNEPRVANENGHIFAVNPITTLLPGAGKMPGPR